MYYHLSDHIYVTQFREEYILLDTQKDKYTICSKEFSGLLGSIFEKNVLFPTVNKEISQEFAFIERLLADKIIAKEDVLYPFYIDKKPNSSGVPNVDWRLPLKNSEIKFNLRVLQALWSLIRVNFYIKFRGFYSGIQLIKNSRKAQTEYSIPTTSELENLAQTLNKACVFYPTRTKCLEWAMAYVLLALKRKWRCNMEVGVQNYPFFAHAWVECDGKVVMDKQNLRTGMAVILNEPFRKLRL